MSSSWTDAPTLGVDELESVPVLAPPMPAPKGVIPQPCALASAASGIESKVRTARACFSWFIAFTVRRVGAIGAFPTIDPTTLGVDKKSGRVGDPGDVLRDLVRWIG